MVACRCKSGMYGQFAKIKMINSVKCYTLDLLAFNGWYYKDINYLLPIISCLLKYFITLFTCLTVHTYRQVGPGGVLQEVHNSSQTLVVPVQRALLAFSVTRHHARMESGWQPGVLGPAAVTDGASGAGACHAVLTIIWWLWKAPCRVGRYFCIKSIPEFTWHRLDSKRADVNNNGCNLSVRGTECGAGLIVYAHY